MSSRNSNLNNQFMILLQYMRVHLQKERILKMYEKYNKNIGMFV